MISNSCVVLSVLFFFKVLSQIGVGVGKCSVGRCAAKSP